MEQLYNQEQIVSELLDMGFTKEQAEFAYKNSSNKSISGVIEFLEAQQNGQNPESLQVNPISQDSEANKVNPISQDSEANKGKPEDPSKIQEEKKEEIKEQKFF